MNNVPTGWASDRLKDVAAINVSSLPADTDADYEFDYLEISNVDYHGIVDPKAIERLRYEDAPSRARRRIAANSTVISSVRPNLQAVAFVPDGRADFICSTGFNVVKPKPSKFHPKFAYYHLISENARQYFEATATGVGYPAVGDKDFNRLDVFLPPLPEQQRIAAYLNASCAAIDAAVVAKRRQIETLDAINKTIITKAVTAGITASVELRSSGVEWIGDIPRHWKVEKLKYLTSLIVDGTHITPTYLPDGVPFLRVTDIQDHTIDTGKVKYISPEEHQLLSKRAKAKRGDILLSKNGTIGLVKIVDWDWEFSFFVSLCLLRPYKKLNPHYFSYFFESSLVDQQLSESSKRTSVTNLHLVKIRELLISLPPPDEQSRIVQHLQSKCAEVQSLKDNITNQIATLTAYRKSLIHECVTGQRRITEAEVRAIIDRAAKPTGTGQREEIHA
ncbi:MAG: restriction endonuclease subunit S [Sulfuricella sp.]